MLDSLKVATAAQDAAGNWQRIDHFVWWRTSELSDAQNWTIIVTDHRDSPLLDQSNAAAVHAALEPFAAGEDPDVVFERHSHWAVGYVHAVSIRVFGRDAKVTPAFQALYRLREKQEAYPVLDEVDYSNREYEATLDNYRAAMEPLRDPLPEGWESEVHAWFGQHGQDTFTENRDDRGGYAPKTAIVAALYDLGLLPTAVVTSSLHPPDARADR